MKNTCSIAGSHILLQCMCQNHQGEAAFSTLLIFSFQNYPSSSFPISALHQLWGSDWRVIISYWALRLRSQTGPGPCLPSHYHLSPRSSPLLSDPEHIGLFSFFLYVKLLSSSELFPPLQLISYLLPQILLTHPSEISLNVTLLERHLSNICWKDGRMGEWMDGCLKMPFLTLQSK